MSQGNKFISSTAGDVEYTFVDTGQIVAPVINEPASVTLLDSGFEVNPTFSEIERLKPDDLQSEDLGENDNFPHCKGDLSNEPDRWVCCHDCYRFRKVIPSCGLRNCPRCSLKQQARLMERYLPALEKVETGYKRRLIIVTLTGFRVPQEWLRQNLYMFAIDAMDFLKAHYLGGLVVFEHTWKPITKEYFIHAHAVVIGDFQPQAKLQEEWGRIIYVEDFRKDPQGRPRSDKEAVKAGLTYILKYVSKGADLQDSELSQMKGFRYVHTFGELYNMRLPNVVSRCRFCFDGDLKHGRLGLIDEKTLNRVIDEKKPKDDQPLELLRVITWPDKPAKQPPGYWERRKKELDDWWKREKGKIGLVDSFKNSINFLWLLGAGLNG